MKKWMACMLGGWLVVALCACGAQPTGGEQAATREQLEPTKEVELLTDYNFAVPENWETNQSNDLLNAVISNIAEKKEGIGTLELKTPEGKGRVSQVSLAVQTDTALEKYLEIHMDYLITNSVNAEEKPEKKNIKTTKIKVDGQPALRITADYQHKEHGGCIDFVYFNRPEEGKQDLLLYLLYPPDKKEFAKQDMDMLLPTIRQK